MISKLADHAPGLVNFLFPQVREDSYVVQRVDGQLPSYLRGTYYLTGPAGFERGGLRYTNWLDADGMVCSLRFEDSSVRFANRYVRGRKFTDEDAAGEAIYAAFGTRFDGDRMRRGIATESPYNVSVLRFRGALLAFGEQSIPMELDPLTLETLGEYDFDRQLNGLSPFSAHPKLDAETGEFFNFGISFSSRQPCVNLYRIDAQGQLACRRRSPIDAACSIHDFAVSKRYVAIYLSPYILDVSKIMKEGVATLHALQWRPDLESTLLIFSRDDFEEVARISIGNRYALHTINAFDSGDQLTVDVIELDRPVYGQYQVLADMFADAPAARPARLVIDLAKKRIQERQELTYCACQDFPAIDNRLDMCPYDDMWTLGISATGKPGRKFFDNLVHASWSSPEVKVYQTPAGRYLGGEPAFVADPHHDRAGSLICQEMDATTSSSEFVVFDAFDVSRGPVARLGLNSPIHFGFHSSFYPA